MQAVQTKLQETKQDATSFCSCDGCTLMCKGFHCMMAVIEIAPLQEQARFGGNMVVVQEHVLRWGPV